MKIPRLSSVVRTLAVGLLATSVFVARPATAAAQEGPGSAWSLYHSGRPDAARAQAERATALAATEERLPALRTALNICVARGELACLQRLAPRFEAAARTAPADQAGRAMLALEAHFYLEHWRRAAGVSAQEILAAPLWRSDIVYGDRLLYLRRQLLAARLRLESGDAAGARAGLDRALSLAASLQGAQGAPPILAASLVEAMTLLAEAGEMRRAHGLMLVSRERLAAVLPTTSPDGVRLRLLEADLLQEAGDAAGALRAVEAALSGLAGMEAAARLPLLTTALDRKAGLLVAGGDAAAALEVLAAAPPADHPLRLFLRLAASAAAGEADKTAWAALSEMESPDDDDRVLQAAGRVLSGDRAAVNDLRRRLQTARGGTRAGGGQFARLGVLDAMLIRLALQAPDRATTSEQQEALFAMLQLAARTAAAQDADALAALSSARTDLQRRAVHQGLRLKARRDRLERDGFRRVAESLSPAGADPVRLTHDFELRARLRDYDLRLAETDQVLARDGLGRAGDRTASLAKAQAALGQDEVLLATSAAADGRWAYLCVRRSHVEATSHAVNPGRFKVDGRLVQAALTAGHAPSDALDSQYPVEAAVRLYDVLLRPFEACLKPGDRILWLGGADSTPVPVAALLTKAPAKLAVGHDLASADWVVRRHAISHLGSAALLTASRASRSSGGDLGFLGVGDPVLTRSQGGSVRGVRLDTLAALAETKLELEASSRGFPKSRLLLQASATEGAVRSQMLGSYRYLSFATHGLLREELEGVAEPSLVLTPTAGRGAADDGLLTASEIADMNLAADFVALSACNTANFDLGVATEELPALASAFAVAGAPATLGTLWPVDSLTGQLVVSDVFARLKAQGVAPGDALAAAQRAFLDAAPDKARLHPRFWAPFVVLGDGGAAPRPAASRAKLAKVEVLTASGGEVVALTPTAGGQASLFIGDRDASGRHGAGVRMASTAGEAWRVEQHGWGASPVLLPLGDRLLAGGYEMGTDGRATAVLRVASPAGLDLAWREAMPGTDAFPLAAVRSDSAVLIAVADLDLHRSGQGGRLAVHEIGDGGSARRLFELQTPGRAPIVGAVLAPVGGQVLLAVTYERAADEQVTLDDYDMRACRVRRETRLELRDRASGALLREASLADVGISSALAASGRVLLGGSRRSNCQWDQKAIVLSVGADLKPAPLYEDDSLGASEVRALASAGGGRVLAVGMKENVVEIRAPKADPGADPYGLDPFAATYSGLTVLLGANGKASAPELLDSGSNIYVTAASPTEGGVLIGGALGGQAALFHLHTEHRP